MAAAGAATSTAAQDRASAKAAAPDHDVTVVGTRLPEQRHERAARYVRAVAATPTDGQIARWHQSICVAARGVEPSIATYIRHEVERTATEVGATVASGRCRPNVLIQFTPDAGQLLGALERRDPRLLMQVSAAQRTRLRAPELPVRWWPATLTKGTDGAPLSADPPVAISGLAGLPLPTDERTRWGNSYNSSLIRTNLRVDLDGIIILVDASRATGLKLSQVAAIAAFAAISGASMPSAKAPIGSVLDLLDPDGDRQISSLTSGDLAYLTALYRLPADRTANTQRLFLVNALRSRD